MQSTTGMGHMQTIIVTLFNGSSHYYSYLTLDRPFYPRLTATYVDQTFLNCYNFFSFTFYIFMISVRKMSSTMICNNIRYSESGNLISIESCTMCTICILLLLCFCFYFIYDIPPRRCGVGDGA